MDKRIKLQLALDLGSLDEALNIAREIEKYIDIIEIGTPLIKKYGIESVRVARKAFDKAILLADMKTMDGGVFEAEIAFEAGADLTTVMACADYNTIQNVINIAKNYKKKVMVDMLGYQLGIKDFESKLVFLDYTGA